MTPIFGLKGCCRVWTLLLFSCMLQLKPTEGDYVLEVRAHSYSNSDHMDRDGYCCESFFTCCCTTHCDNRFVFCLRPSGTAHDGNEGNCPLGRYTTGEIGDDSFNFGSTSITTGVPNPMVFTGSLWTGSVQLFIDIHDVDSREDDPVDEIYITVSRSISSSFSSQRTYDGRYGNSRISLSFRVQCATNFYGSNCGTRCVPRDDATGHFTCGSDGQKVCLPGWTDTASACTTSVSNSLCATGCNLQGASCSSRGECICHSGWDGPLCTECTGTRPGCSPKGGYCNTPGECLCSAGYAGDNCEVLIDFFPCENQSPCQNGATCSNDGRGGYSCSCPRGYEGDSCQTEINECSPDPCRNGATCSNDGRGGYSCECEDGFTGKNCSDSSQTSQPAGVPTLTAAVAGGVILLIICLLVLVIVIVVAFVVFKKRRDEGHNQSPTTSSNPTYDSPIPPTLSSNAYELSYDTEKIPLNVGGLDDDTLPDVPQ